MLSIPVAVDKDTIIFRASAVKINKGEMAIDILAQMPGVEITESSATVLNEDVKRVYVDGALLFGNAPMNALNNLPVTRVSSAHTASAERSASSARGGMSSKLPIGVGHMMSFPGIAPLLPSIIERNTPPR